jgi:predicted Rossmann fold flavoprotein
VKRKKIAVVGAGPAGMMAAIRAAGLQQEVTLLEKNPSPGEKLLLSGKGRCNLTNLSELDEFLQRFSGGGQFLRDAFNKFFHRDLINFFEKGGLALKVERQRRVFPKSDRAESVLEALKRELLRCGVRLKCNIKVRDIIASPLGPAERTVQGLRIAGNRFIAAERVILAAGGVTYPFTGSCGGGLRMAAALGHRITDLRPGLVPLEIRQEGMRHLAGLSLKNIRLKFFSGKNKIISGVGELLFTHTGISGPLVLSLSGRVADWLKQEKGVYAEIDLKPALTPEQLDSRLLREFKAGTNKSLKNILKELLPQRLIAYFLQITDIAPLIKANQVTSMQRRALIRLLKGWRLDITRPRPIQEAMITRGGVSLKEINPRTMESRLVKGLYFAGEIIDVDADTGGFNLQAAFSTGYLAGESASLD